MIGTCRQLILRVCEQGAKHTAKQSSASTHLSQAAVSAAIDLTQEDEEDARRQAEVTLTTELIDIFQQHSSVWEAIEVSPCLCASKPDRKLPE